MGRTERKNKIQQKSLLKIDRKKQITPGFHQYYDGLSTPIVILSPELKIIYINQAAEKHYNIKRKKLIGRFCYDEFNCDISKKINTCPVTKVVKNGKSYNLKILNHFGLDETHLKAFPIKNERNEVTGICLEDYTNLVHVKNQVETIESRFKKIVGVAAFAIFVLGKDFKIEFANLSAEEMLQDSIENIAGTDFRDYLRDEDIINFIESMYSDNLEMGRVCFYSDRLIYFGKDNLNVVELCLSRAKEYDENKIYIYLSNITKEIKLQDDLKKTNKFLQNLINGSPNSIIASDKNDNIIMFNEKAEKLLGYKAGEVVGKIPISRMYPDGYIEEVKGRLRSSEHGSIGKTETVEAIVIDQQGSEIPCRLSAYLIHDKDDIEEALVLIFYDLRARKQMQKELEETQMKLFQSEKMSSLGKLAAGIAHEINNPLGGIMIFAETILEDLEENDAIREDLQRIASEARRCKNIVKGLLEFSRQTGNTMSFYNINDLIEQGMVLLENQAIFHNIDVIKEYDKDLPLVKCDSARLKQVFINITQNAIDAMGAKGTFTIKTGINKERQRVEIEFSDTGSGVPKEIRQKIFDPFFSTKEVGKGTGLGLSMSYGIIKDHGGTINVKSDGRTGASFIIELPIES